MKTAHLSVVIFSLFFALVFALVLSNFDQPAASAQGSSSAAIYLQTTPPPQTEDTSVIGSTDGILVMGIVIVLIVTLPLLFRKKEK